MLARLSHFHPKLLQPILNPLLGGLILIGLFAYTMTHRLSHDEQMYITAGVLLKQYRLYQDFAYLQMPYLP